MRRRAIVHERARLLEGEHPDFREQRAETHLVCGGTVRAQRKRLSHELEGARILRQARIPREDLGPACLDERANAALGYSPAHILEKTRSEDVTELDGPDAFVHRARHVIHARVHKAGRPRVKANAVTKSAVLQRPALNIEQLDLLVPVPRAAAVRVSVELGSLEDVRSGIGYFLDALLVPAPKESDVVGVSHRD